MSLGRLFSLVAGARENVNVYEMQSLISKRRFNLKRLNQMPTLLKWVLFWFVLARWSGSLQKFGNFLHVLGGHSI